MSRFNPAPVGGGGPQLSFVYQCTGTADSTAIAGILNDFFNASTAMSMKLIITGTMGVEYSYDENFGNIAVLIDAANDRGATAYLDFSDCSIPECENFLVMRNTYAKLVVFGLNVTGEYSALSVSPLYDMSGSPVFPLGEYPSGNIVANNCNFIAKNQPITLYYYGGNVFNNCNITSTESYGGAIVSYYGDNNKFLNCNINAEGVACDINASSVEFINCIINAIEYSGATLTSSGQVKNIKYINCGIISSNDDAIQINNPFTATLLFDKCKIISASHDGIVSNTSDKTAKCKIINCHIRGSGNDIYQGSPSYTISWHLHGNSFAGPMLMLNGGQVVGMSGNAQSDYLYAPDFANWFNQIID